MRHSALLSAAFVASLLPVALAQQSANLVPLPPEPASCPVSLSIHQRSPTEVVRAEDSPQTSPDSPVASVEHLEIAFRPHPSVRPIDSIELRVRGVGERRQTLPLGSAADGSRPDDLQQSFQLRRTAGTPTLNRADIRVARMNAIRWVELVSVTYTDGTVWRPAAGLSCRTEPNRLLLVAEGQ